MAVAPTAWTQPPLARRQAYQGMDAERRNSSATWWQPVVAAEVRFAQQSAGVLGLQSSSVQVSKTAAQPVPKAGLSWSNPSGFAQIAHAAATLGPPTLLRRVVAPRKVEPAALLASASTLAPCSGPVVEVAPAKASAVPGLRDRCQAVPAGVPTD